MFDKTFFLSFEQKQIFLNCFMENFYRYSITTNFQPNKARTVFPCFDEPEFKAEYIVDITYHQNYSALSNMPEVFTDPINDTEYVVTKFQRSFKMSTHSFGFTVSIDAEYSMVDSNIRIFGPVS